MEVYRQVQSLSNVVAAVVIVVSGPDLFLFLDVRLAGYTAPRRPQVCGLRLTSVPANRPTLLGSHFSLHLNNGWCANWIVHALLVPMAVAFIEGITEFGGEQKVEGRASAFSVQLRRHLVASTSQ